MNKILISATVLSIATLSSLGSAQCELYYKFDRGVGTGVVNYGTAAVSSTMVNAGVGPWSAAGKYGGALAGSANNSSAHYNYCSTGFGDAVAGSFTVSWWCKQQYSPGTGLSYAYSGRGSFRCFTNGVAGAELWCRAWGGVDLKLPTSGSSFQTRAASTNGVNVALVVDGTGLKAQWYIDGAPHGAAITIAVGANIVAGTDFLIGKHSSNSSSFAYGIDEFRFCKRAASAAEIKAWHNLATAASGRLGKPCGIKLASGGGAPKVNNVLHTLDFSGPSSLKYLLVVGVKPDPGFDMGSYFPALAGCTWYTEFLIQVPGASATGSGSIPAPIIGVPAGIGVEAQILGFDSAGKPVMSNMLSLKVEKQ